MMMRALALILLLSAASRTLRAQEAAAATMQAAFDSAGLDWSAGRYPDALARLERLLAAPGGAAVLEQAALLTGELYHTDSLAPDGRDLRWSADGRWAMWSSGAAASRRIALLDVSRGRQAPLVIPGRAAVFSPAGAELAYLAVRETPAIRALGAQIDSFTRSRDAAGILRSRTELTRLENESARIMIRDLRSGREREIRAPGLWRQSLAWTADGRSLFVVGGPTGEPGRSNIYALGRGAPVPVVEGSGQRTGLLAAPGERYLVYQEAGNVVLRDLQSGNADTFRARSYAASADGSTIAFVQRDSAAGYGLFLQRLASGGEPVAILRSQRPIDNPALSADGSRVAYQIMPREDWEIHIVGADGKGDRRLTWDVQHDIFPRFLGNDRLLGVMGEARHRRSYVYDLATGTRRRLFHNNTVRTVSAEYEWAVSPDGSKVLIVAERDGDTISPERSVFLTDLSRRVTQPEVLARVRASLALERDLRDRGRRTFAPIEGRVREALAEVSVSRIYEYERDLYAFGTKYVTKPGNGQAIQYLAARLRAFGYEPELQWFEPMPGVRSANVIARLRGSRDSSLVYVISSHFDSVEEGPGSDDNTSGTTALLEAARVMADRPQAATIEFAFFTGEEAGLLGSREYVRRAVAGGKRIVGALNNDMIGFANDERLDNTIRYSNDGLRDLQHAAAFLFTDLVTYDARYYKNTDAHAYYEQYGDIVGGIGSYPILGNPHYHQPHDVLETINHRLVAEVSRVTVASIMAMASAPSRLAGLKVERRPGGTAVSWTPAPETGVGSYVVAYGPPGNRFARQVTVTEPRVTLPDAPAGTVVSVRAAGEGGLQGWDWVRAVVK